MHLVEGLDLPKLFRTENQTLCEKIELVAGVWAVKDPREFFTDKCAAFLDVLGRVRNHKGEVERNIQCKDLKLVNDHENYHEGGTELTARSFSKIFCPLVDSPVKTSPSTRKDIRVGVVMCTV
jgi:hypothetical protein